jgi:hypothetical protein
MYRIANVGAVVTIGAALAFVWASIASSEPRSHKSVVLASGTANGQPWELTVGSEDHTLCMQVDDPLNPNPQPDASGMIHDFMGGGCGFGPSGSDHGGDCCATPTMSSSSDKVTMVFGPAPQNAVRVRIDSFSVDSQPPGPDGSSGYDGCRLSNPPHLWVNVTHRLPGWAKRGGWFLTEAPAPSAGQCGYLDAVFYDRNGDVVHEPKW